MHSIFNRFPYGKKILAALGGTTTAQAINILGALAIARIYAPTDFGLFASWLGLTHILTNCLSHMLEHAFGLEPDGDERYALVVTAVTISLATAMVAGVFVLIAYLVTQFFFDDGVITITPILWWLLIPQSLGATLSLVWQSWAANNGNFHYLAKIRILQAIFIVSSQILIGIRWPDVAALATAQTFGMLLSVGLCCYLMPLRIPFRHDILLRHVRNYWYKYRKFPLLALPASLIGVTADRLPIILIAVRFGTEVAGYYALVARVMATPIALVGGAVLDVFKRSAATERDATGRCEYSYQRTFFLLLALSAIVTIAAWLFVYDFFLLVFGEQWVASGSMAVWLLPMTATAFVASPLSYMFFIMQKQGVNLCWQTCLCGMTALAFIYFDSYKESIFVYSFCYAILNIICIMLSYIYSKTNNPAQQ